MSNFYLCDLCEKKRADIDAESCICWAAPVKKVAVPDCYDGPLAELCPWGMFEPRGEGNDR